MPAGPRDLSSLANLKGALRITASTDDVLLQRLLSACSQFYQNWLNRAPIVAQARSETFNGRGGTRQFLNHYPVLAVASVTVDGTAIVQSTGPLVAGWTFDDTSVYLIGYRFNKGVQNVVIPYTGGLGAVEAYTIPGTPYQVSVVNANSAIFSDLGVVYAGGAALTKVGSAPAAGQYSVAAGVYTFAAADSGKAVSITYGYVEMDLENAVIETVKDRYETLNRMGQTSKNLEGQVVSFSIKDLQPWNRTVLEQYAKRVHYT